MKIQRSALDEGVAALTLTGEFDSFAANPFLEQVDAIIHSGTSNVVANLRLVLFINSTAIGSLIKARKRLKGLGGDLVIAEPSARVKETLSSLGLEKVIRTFNSDDDAIHFLCQAEDAAVDIPSENTVLLRFAEAAKQKAFKDSSSVAKIKNLAEDGIKFTTSAQPSLFESGTKVKVKFRLPLFRKNYFFEIDCAVASTSSESGGQTVFAEFQDISDDDQRAIADFVREMRLLRDEAHSAE